MPTQWLLDSKYHLSLSFLWPAHRHKLHNKERCGVGSLYKPATKEKLNERQKPLVNVLQCNYKLIHSWTLDLAGLPDEAGKSPSGWTNLFILLPCVSTYCTRSPPGMFHMAWEMIHVTQFSLKSHTNSGSATSRCCVSNHFLCSLRI